MNNRCSMSVIILTFNESLHIERCIKSLMPFAEKIFVVDSFSTDDTVEKARRLGAEVYQNPWINYANQLNWGIDNLPIETDWIMRIDADEVVTSELSQELLEKLPNLSDEQTGIIIKRRVHFMGRWIKHGSYYPTFLLRFWRKDVGSIEARWMDEHIVLSKGESIHFDFDIIDDNLNNLTWWTQKHNSYASREAIDLLNLKYGLFDMGQKVDGTTQTQAGLKRWLKDRYYVHIPLGLRAILYFIYRYFFRLGFLDGFQGLLWHTLQGFWYRMLVDAKVYEVERKSKIENISIEKAIKDCLNFKLSHNIT